MLSRRMLPLAALIVLCSVLAGPSAADAVGAQGYAPIEPPANPADQPPFDGGKPYLLAVPPAGTKPPSGFRLTATWAQAIATETVKGNVSGAGRVRVRIRLGSDGQNQWQGDFYEPDGEDVAEVVVDDATAGVVEKWTGSQVDTKLARGYRGAVAGEVNRW